MIEDSVVGEPYGVLVMMSVSSEKEREENGCPSTATDDERQQHHHEEHSTPQQSSSTQNKRVSRKDRIHSNSATKPAESSTTEPAETSVPEISDSATASAATMGSPLDRQRSDEEGPSQQQQQQAEERSSPRTSIISSDGNPQDPPTLDESETTAAAAAYHDQDQFEEAPSEMFQEQFMGDDSEPLESKIAHFVDLRTAGSRFFQENPPASLPVFDTDEIKLGMLLGQGEFGTVREVVEISDKAGHQDLPTLLKRLQTRGAHHNRQVSMDVSFMTNASSNGGGHHRHDRQASTGVECLFEHDDHYEEIEEGNSNNNNNKEETSLEFKDLDEAKDIEQVRRARRVLTKRCWREGKARYAVKQLRTDLEDYIRDDDADFDHQYRTIGAMDLAMEAKLLASFSHPNICKLRGTAGVPGLPDYMLILDRLYMTLDEKIDEWRHELKSYRGLLNSCKGLLQQFAGRPSQHASDKSGPTGAVRNTTSSRHKFEKEQLLHRLYAAFDVARALRHLHHHRLLYRDLKPENIAFDIRGDIRIFDFGLCKELVDSDLMYAPDDYNATGMTGSRRWMAPEVYLCAPYGLSADVYSYGLLLWNLCSLKTPFGKRLTCDSHHKRVILKRERPKRLPSKVISTSLWNLMDCCWSVNRSKRPSFEEICALLRSEISALSTLREDVEGPSSPPSKASIDVPVNASEGLPSELVGDISNDTFHRSNTAETFRRSNRSSFGSANKQGKKSLWKRIFPREQDPRKRVRSGKYDAVNTSCHVKGRHKQAYFRNKHNSQSWKKRTSLLIPRSFMLRRSNLEDRSVYLMEKSDLSMEECQLDSSNYSSKASNNNPWLF